MAEAKRYYPLLNLHYTPDGPSVYGEPDPATTRLIGKIKKKGQVLEPGAGDGRYTKLMLEQGLQVIASDVDREPLDVLEQRASANAGKLSTAVFDAFKRFPIPDKSVDAVVSTAFIYLYPPGYIKKFAIESHRVLKEKGKLIIDFVTDRKRTGPDGNEIKGENEIQYDFKHGKKTIRKVLKEVGFKKPKKRHIEVSQVHQDLTASAGYIMEATKRSVLAKKKKKR